MLTTEQQIELGKRIKHLDQSAFHTLYDECFQRLYAFAFRFVYDKETAEDIVQDAFFSLWINIKNYDDSKNVVTYLTTIVKNSCLNHLRSLKIRGEHTNKLIESMLFLNLTETEVDETIRARLNAVLSKLTPKSYQILISHVVEKRKIKDLAIEHHVAESTIKSGLRDSMRLLRKNLLFILIGVEFFC